MHNKIFYFLCILHIEIYCQGAIIDLSNTKGADPKRRRKGGSYEEQKNGYDGYVY